MKNSKNQRMRVAVVGLGKQAEEDHLPAILDSSDVELVAVVDKDKNKLKNFHKKHPSVRGYKLSNELFNHEKLDFIVLAVPHCHHYEITRQSIMKGVHILKEKPFATSLEDAGEIMKLADRKKVEVSVTLQRRFNPIYHTFLQLIDKIGRQFYFNAKYTLFTPDPDSGWRGQKKLAGGGCLIDMGYHIIDLLIWYFGLPDGIIAFTSHNAKEFADYNAEDTASLLLKYSLRKSHFGNLLVSRSIQPKQETLDVYGTRGCIHLERGKIERYKTDGSLIESLERQQGWPSAARDQIEYFVNVIRGKCPNLSGPRYNLQHLAFIEAAYESVKTKRIVNPKDLLKDYESH